MTNLNSASRLPARHTASPRFDVKAAFLLASASMLLSACGGGGGGSSTGNPQGGGSGNAQGGSTTLLQVGMQRQYSGKTVYSSVTTPMSPGGAQSQTTSFTEQVRVLAAPTSSGAAYDVQTVTNYTTVSSNPNDTPLSGTTTLDTYQNLVTQGTSQHIETTSSKSTDINSTKQATITTISYPTPIPGESYPLQIGVNLPLPIALVSNSIYETVNSQSDLTPTGANVTTTQLTRKADGSVAETEAIVQAGQPNFASSYSINADGSATSTDGTTTAKIGAPVNTGINAVIYTIPVTVSYSTGTGTAVTTNNYNATDWYPGNGLLSSPLVSASRTVVGAVTTLPAACSGALTQPNMFEVDTKETELKPLGDSQLGNYIVTTTQAFVSNGVVVCLLKKQAAPIYSVESGISIATTETDTTRVLTGLINP